MDALPPSTVTRFAAARVRSLAWDGDTLVDWVDGGVRWTLDGERRDRSVIYGFPFDLAATLPDSPWAVIYQRRGTKGVVLREGRVIREIDRSFYFANAYEYPIALFRSPSGRPAIVHCPQDYNRLRIDDLETGEVLACSSDSASDFFHSRLVVSPDGRWLASAGWLWHPIDDIGLYDLQAAFADGTTLDRGQVDLEVLTERGNAAGFDARSRLLVTADMGGWDDEEADASRAPCVMRLTPGRPETLERRPLAFDSAFMAVGDSHLLTLAGHPRLLSINTGRHVAAWPDIQTVVPGSSVQSGTVEFTPIACDPTRGRAAFAHDGQISVIEFELSASTPT